MVVLKAGRVFAVRFDAAVDERVGSRAGRSNDETCLVGGKQSAVAESKGSSGEIRIFRDDWRVKSVADYSANSERSARMVRWV